MTLVLTVEAGQPVRARVRFDRPKDEARAYSLSVEAAALAYPLRRLMDEAERTNAREPGEETRAGKDLREHRPRRPTAARRFQSC